MTTAATLLMSSTWNSTLGAAKTRREEGGAHTHTLCAPYTAPLSVTDNERFLSDYFSYYCTLPQESATGQPVPSSKLNAITEKLSPNREFPFFVDLDFDAAWFNPTLDSDQYVTMDAAFVFRLVGETISLFQDLIADAMDVGGQPVEVLVSMRAFYKCHVHFPDIFVAVPTAIALCKEACRVTVARYPEYAGNINKAFDCGVYSTGLRILGSHKGRLLGKDPAERLRKDWEAHTKYLPGHAYRQQYLLADVDMDALAVTFKPLTLEHLQMTSLFRPGEALPVKSGCKFLVTASNRCKRKAAAYLPRPGDRQPPIEELGDDADWEDVARVCVMQALREANMDPTVTRVRRYQNTGFIEATLSPRECPMKNAAHKRTQERGGAANYVLVGVTHMFLRCWKCENSIQLEDTSDRLRQLMDFPAQHKHYTLFASLHENTHELISNVLFEAMKETYSVVAINDNKYLWYYFDATRHRWIQYEKVMTAIMEDKGEIQNMWSTLVKELKAEMVPPQDADGQGGGKTEIYETGLLRKLIRNLQNVGFIKHSIMVILARKIDWHWKQQSKGCIPFQQLLDSKPNLIGFSNGVFDSKEGIFRPGQPDDFISKSTHVDYVPWADQPVDLRDGLMGFLSQVQSVPEELNYLLWAIASSFRGDAAVRQAFYFWIGMGANAKSTLIRMINNAMGDYACETPVTLFTRERPSSEKPCPEIVATRGCRFASAPEPGLSDEFVMSTLKWLSGSDKLTARRLNENMQSWYGTATYHCSMNGIPLITSKDEDYGTWRRLIVIMFESRFVPNPSGPREFKKMESAQFEEKLQTWAAPLVALLVDIMIQKVEVPLPPAFAKATEELKLKNDIIGKFVAHSVTRDPDTFCEVMDAFAAFNTFKRVANVKGRPVTEDQFTLYISTNVGPLRTRVNNNKTEKGWGIVIRPCGVAGVDRGFNPGGY